MGEREPEKFEFRGVQTIWRGSSRFRESRYIQSCLEERGIRRIQTIPHT